jgi:hypothetical protein
MESLVTGHRPWPIENRDASERRIRVEALQNSELIGRGFFLQELLALPSTTSERIHRSRR